ncbi:hypothetical protein C8J56DRAFT_826905 [Mycena floridula]|nr:hypothetical protein C8J56DRAFT_826905 [Mycena floridula]
MAQLNVDLNNTSIGDVNAPFMSHNTVHTGASDAEIVAKLQQRSERSPREYQAGSRDDVVKRVLDWVAAPSSPKIFWLCSAAGVGGSTIARHLVDVVFPQEGCLASFFFFKRRISGDWDMREIIHAMAHDLVAYQSGTEYLVAEAARAHYPSNMPASEYFDRFILTPLSSLNPEKPFVIVLDGLDECLPSLEFLAALNASGNSNIKVLLTGRPDEELKDYLVEMDVQQYDLLGVADVVMEQFLQSRLGKIKGWRAGCPTKDEMTELIRLAGGLLRWASTVCSFLSEKMNGKPDYLLRTILLLSERESYEERLTELYAVALKHLFSKPAHALKFRQVFGAMLVIDRHLSQEELELLLGDKLPVLGVVGKLRSLENGKVFGDSSDWVTPVTDHFHSSFLDFVVDPKRCKDDDLRVIVPNSHAFVAQQCFASLSTFFDSSTEAQLLNNQPSVLYAAQKWAFHVSKIVAPNETLPDDLSGKVQQFLKHDTRFIPWAKEIFKLERMMSSLADKIPIEIFKAPSGAEKLREMGIRLVDLSLAGGQAIDLALDLHNVALRLSDSTDPKHANIQCSLANAYATSFSERGIYPHLKQSIDIGKELVQLYRKRSDPQLPIYLCNLIVPHMNSLEQDGLLEGLDSCIDMAQEAVKICPHPHPYLSHSLHSLASALHARFRHHTSKNIQDLNQSIELSQEAAQLSSFEDDGQDHIMIHTELAAARLDRHNALINENGDQDPIHDDLSLSINDLENLLSHCPSGSIGRDKVLQTLALSLRARYWQQRGLDDLSRCIELGEEALDLYLPGNTHRPIALFNLSIPLYDWF